MTRARDVESLEKRTSNYVATQARIGTEWHRWHYHTISSARS